MDNFSHNVKRKKTSADAETERKDKSETNSSKVQIPQSSKSDFELTPNWQDYELLADNLSLNLQLAKNIIALFENGNEIPFIARYRKTETENMSPDQLREAKECFEEIKLLKNKMQTVLKTLNKNEVLDQFLLQKITNCRDIEELEHIVSGVFFLNNIKVNNYYILYYLVCSL